MGGGFRANDVREILRNAARATRPRSLSMVLMRFISNLYAPRHRQENKPSNAYFLNLPETMEATATMTRRKRSMFAEKAPPLELSSSVPKLQQWPNYCCCCYVSPER